MILEIKNHEIELFDSGKITMQLWGGVYFEGYFFVGDKFFRGNDAIEYIVSNKDSITKKLHELNGIYICLIFDTKKKRITIFNDKICFQSLCWFLSGDKKYFAISDSFFDLQNHLGIHEFDETSILEFLSYRFVSGKYTLLKEIYQIEPASIYTLEYNSDIRFEKTEWYQYHVSFKGHKKADKELYDIQTRLFRKYRKAFGNTHIQLNLTGGLDSRYILGYLLKEGFDFETNTFGTKQCEEIRFVSKLANKYKFKSNTVILGDNFIEEFYDNENVERITRSIGFKTYYYQGYFFDSLYKQSNDDIMMSGDNGFILGLMYKDSVIKIESHDELAEFLVKSSFIIPYKELKLFYKNSPDSYEELFARLKRRVYEQLDLSNDIFSEYLKWGLFNRERNYCDKNYLIYSKYTFPVYPNYDNEFFEFMLDCSVDELKNEQVYRDSMCKYHFVGPLEGLRKVPVDQRGVLKRINRENWNFRPSSLYQKTRNMDVHFSEHFNIRSNYLSIPFNMIRRNQKLFNSFLDITFDSSNILNADSIKRAGRRNTRSFYALRLPILSTLATVEKLVEE